MFGTRTGQAAVGKAVLGKVGGKCLSSTVVA